jgi:hypothetical protein
MKTTVLKDKDRVWLEGVSGWFSGDRESSVHAAEAAIMEALDEGISYTDLLGVSSLAFRMQISKSGLCPSSPHAFCGYKCVDRGVQAIPYKLQVFEVAPDDLEKVKHARQAVVASINRGVPVQYGSEEDGIIVGYQKHGEEWICFHPMREGGKKTFVETNWPWGIAIFTERKTEIPNRHALALDALMQAAEMAELSESGDYHLGWAAWDAYIDKIEQLQRADEKTINDNMLGNAWIFECLVQYRREAAAYLRNIAGLFEESVAHHIHNSADLYDKMANQVLTDKDHCVLTVAPYPWSLKKGETWNNALRADQINRLMNAYPLERKAIDEIKFLLSL